MMLSRVGRMIFQIGDELSDESHWNVVADNSSCIMHYVSCGFLYTKRSIANDSGKVLLADCCHSSRESA